MVRPTTIRDDDIIAAARSVFLERGAAATTAEVASRAGVSEGSIFKRFKSKAKLFMAAMQTGDPPFVVSLEARVGKGTVPEQLEQLTRDMYAFLRIALPIILMAQSVGLSASELGKPNTPPVRVIKRVAAYIEAETRLGRIRRTDPEVVARLLTGAVFQYVLLDTVLHTSGELPLPFESFVRSLVDTLWRGVAPPAKPAQSR